MKTIARSLVVTTLFASVASIAACGAPPGSETSASSGEAIAEAQRFTFTESQVQALLKVVDVAGVQLSVSNQTLTLTPSPSMVQLMAPGDSVAQHAVTQFIPDAQVDLPFPCGTSWATLTGINLDSSAIGADLVNDHVDFHVGFGASVHMHTGWGCPDFDVMIHQATLDVNVARNTSVAGSDALTIQSAPVNVLNWSADCGLAGWCSGLIEWLAPSFNAKLSSSVASALNGAIAANSGQVAKGVDGALAALMSVNLTVDHQGTPWQAVPGSLAISSSQAMWSGQHMLPPVVGTCAVMEDCNGFIEGYCAGSSGDPERLQRWTGSTWIDVGTAMSPAAEETDTSPPMNADVLYRTYATNAAGTSYSNQVWIHVSPATGCGGGGGGGGSSSGGGGHRGGCGTRCT